MSLVKQYSLLKHKNQFNLVCGWSVSRSQAVKGKLTPARVVRLRLKSYGLLGPLCGPLVWAPHKRSTVGGIAFLFKGQALPGSWSGVVGSLRATSTPIFRVLPYLACFRSSSLAQVRLVLVLRAIRSRLLHRIS